MQRNPFSLWQNIWPQVICISLLPFFFQAKNDPFKKESSKKEAEDKASFTKSCDKRSSTGVKLTNKWVTEEDELYVD